MMAAWALAVATFVVVVLSLLILGRSKEETEGFLASNNSVCMASFAGDSAFAGKKLKKWQPVFTDLYANVCTACFYETVDANESCVTYNDGQGTTASGTPTYHLDVTQSFVAGKNCVYAEH